MVNIPGSYRPPLAIARVLIAAAMLASGCAARRGDLPPWIERLPEDDSYLYAVGTRTGAATIEEGRRGAIEQAVAELVRRFGVTARTSYSQTQTELATQVRDEIQASSGKVQIKDSVVQDWYLRHTGTGYDAFVLLRYPREQAEREEARLRSDEASALFAATHALQRGDAARSRGDIAAAIAAYLEVGELPDSSASAVGLRSQAASRLSGLAASLQVEAVSGEHQAVRPLAPASVVVRATADGAPVAGLPLRFGVDGGQVELSPESPTTGADGTAVVIVRPRASTSVLLIHAGADIDRLRPNGSSRVLPDGIATAVEAIEARQAGFLLSVDRTARAPRIAVLIDERDREVMSRRSVLSDLLSERLVTAGFRVVSAQDLGRTNLELLEHVLDRDEFIPLSAEISGFIDIAIGGWCETRLGSENGGWATSVLADANIKAVELTHGELIAAHSVIGRVGFGEREDLARMNALKAAATELVEALVRQLADHVDTASDQPGRYLADQVAQ